MAITRDADTDDDGTGTTGTIRNAAWKTQLYDRIDAAIDGADATTRTVAKGGTGATTFTDGGVLVGNGTAAIQATAVGSAGEVLTSNGAGLDPTFQAVSVTATNTVTLTNKRITPRVTTEASNATPSINTDAVDAHSITALAVAITSVTATGTPTNFQKLVVRLKDDGTARAITWGASFEAKGVALPTTTTASKVTTVGFIYDSVTAKWGCVASVTEA